jgi:ATP-dependent protease Clp ATPase subunit
MYSNTRPGAESGTLEAIDDEDNVELEKSNVLLMGPTGSGNDSTLSLCILSPCDLL